MERFTETLHSQLENQRKVIELNKNVDVGLGHAEIFTIFGTVFTDTQLI